MNVPSGEKTIREIADKTDTVMISFSGGKDAIAAWLRIRPYFNKIIPWYMYTVPDLGFIERGLRYYEEYFETRIIRVPQYGLFKQLNTLTYQSPEKARWMEKNDVYFAEYDRDEIRDMIADHLGLTEEQKWTATGISAYDNLARRMMAHKHGAINHNRKVFAPIIDLKKSEILDTIRTHKVKLPEEYKFLGRSFDGIGLQYIYGVRKYYPEDYQKLLEYFPMLEVEFKRYEFRKAR